MSEVGEEGEVGCSNAVCRYLLAAWCVDFDA